MKKVFSKNVDVSLCACTDFFCTIFLFLEYTVPRMLIFVSPVIVFRQHASSWNVYDEAGARGLVIFGLGKSSRPTAAGAPGVAGLRVTLCSLKIPIKCHKWGPSKFLNLDKGELKPYSIHTYILFSFLHTQQYFQSVDLGGCLEIFWAV